MRQELSIPFEKNNYFYGKLLSVEDFDLEQKYGDDKRRLMNRLIYGSGIVTGLYVALVDELTLSVEKGVALDTAGREIVVDAAVMKKLPMLDGFGECMQQEGQGWVYLCLSYAETAVMPVHNVTKNVPGLSREKEADYSRIRENYRLFLTPEEPRRENLSASAFYEEVYTVYREGGVRIRQRISKYVQSGKTTLLVLEVENSDRRNLSFQYDLKLNGLNWEGLGKAAVSFDEILFEKTGQYEISYILTAAEGMEGAGSVTVVPESVHLTLSMEEQAVQIKGRMELQIGSLDRKDALHQNYYRMAMEEVLHSHEEEPLYLARLQLLKTGDTCLIDSLERVPFRQYVRNMVLEQALDRIMEEDGGGKEPGTGRREQDYRLQKRQETNGGILIRGGSYSLPLRVGAQKGEVYYSAEISHGLGLGKTVILLGLEEKNSLCCGQSGIFHGKRLDVALAAKLNTETGTFIIGAKVAFPLVEDVLHIQWTAIRDTKDTMAEQAEKRIFIKPNVLELKVRESCPLEAVCENMPEKAVLWSVAAEGGSIDTGGLYTAPNLPGVYEVVAAGAAYPDIKASLFVVVREFTPEKGRGG